jgi:hypothetical protein
MLREHIEGIRNFYSNEKDILHQAYLRRKRRMMRGRLEVELEGDDEGEVEDEEE